MMFKWQIRYRIRKIKKEILQVEEKMHRPHSACIQALLEGKEMQQEEVSYHKKYMDQIEELREELRELEKKINED